MRVLMTSTPGAGHLYPMVPIALALRDAGHEVTWATAADGVARIEPLGFGCRTAGLDGGARMHGFLERDPGILELPLREWRPRLVRMFSAVAAPVMLEDLEPIVEELDPDLVVNEPLELAAPVVATKRGVPHVTVGFGGLFPDWAFDILEQDIGPIWASEGLGPPPPAGGVYEHLYLHAFPASFGTVPAARNIRPMRPLNYDGDGSGTTPDWVADIGHDRPGIYVTFGTEFGAMAPFDAVIDGVAGLDADVVVTVGHAVDPDGLGAAPTNVRVERYVPQRPILERASLLISHGGSGATLGAASAGVPHLAIPLGADQHDNAAAVAAAGAGLTLDAETLTPESVATNAERLLADASLREVAAGLARELATMPHPSEHVPSLEDLGSGR